MELLPIMVVTLTGVAIILGVIFVKTSKDNSAAETSTTISTTNCWATIGLVIYLPCSMTAIFLFHFGAKGLAAIYAGGAALALLTGITLELVRFFFLWKRQNKS